MAISVRCPTCTIYTLIRSRYMCRNTERYSEDDNFIGISSKINAMNMRTIIIKYMSWLWMGAFSMLFSCDRMNDLHDEYLKRGEITYLSRIDEVKIHPGDKRAELLFVNKDPKAKTMTVYWRSRTDSVVYTIPDNSVGQELKVLLPDLPEDFLTFELVTTSADGDSKSLSTELS